MFLPLLTSRALRAGANGDDGLRRQAAALVALDVAEHAVDAPVSVQIEKPVGVVENPALGDVLAIRLPLREHFRVDLVGEKDLARNELVATAKHFEMNVRRAPAVPARIDRFEAHPAVGVRELRAAQRLAVDGSSLDRDAADAALLPVTGIETEPIGLPEIEA